MQTDHAASEWFLKSPQEEKIHGPYSLEQVWEALQGGKLEPNFLISTDRSLWRPIAEVFSTSASTKKIPHPEMAGEGAEAGGFDREFGHYHLLEKLGQGGMGVVYKALDTRLNRVVALKILIQRGEDPRDVQRFLREAELTAQLKHPHIVELLDVGQTPQLYLTMEYIQGHTLDHLLRAKALPLQSAIALFIKVCSAIECSHHQKILHRDIKPGNILVDLQGEPKVTDFGLARRFGNLQGSDRLSRTGEFLGTPKYVAPEQAEGQEVDPRADIYSLGAVLYEILTDRPPFEGDTILKILAQLATDDPVPPRRLNPDIPPDLERICLACLRRPPRKRYRSVGLLRRDLERFLENKPISLRPPTVAERAWRWMQRNPLPTTLGVLLLVGLLLALALMGMLIRLQQTMVQESYQKGCNAYHRKLFKANLEQRGEHAEFAYEAFSTAIAQKNRWPLLGKEVYAYWMRGCTSLVLADYPRARADFALALEGCADAAAAERCKLHLLLALCAADQKIWDQARTHWEKAEEQFRQVSEEKPFARYLQEMDEANQQLAQTVSFRVPPWDEELRFPEVRYYPLLSLLPGEVAEEAYSRLQKRSDAARDSDSHPRARLRQELFRLRYLLFETHPHWIDAFLKQPQPRVSELKEMLFYIKGQWMLEMASPYWVHLPFELQQKYAAMYQQEYAKQLPEAEQRNPPHLKVIASPSGKVAFEMGLIPPGQFLTGTANAETDEAPQHFVVLTQPFWMSKTEVSRKQWTDVTKQSPWVISPKSKLKILTFPAYGTQDEFPATYMLTYKSPHTQESDKKDIGEFLALLGQGCALPTEAQWEYACKAGCTKEWILLCKGADGTNEYLWFEKNAWEENQRGLRPVGTTRFPNDWGLYDMRGNAAEFCNNYFASYSSDREIDPLSNLNEKNTLGKKNTIITVIRGGYSGDRLSECRSTFRMRFSKEQQNLYVGFRFIQKIP